MMKTFISIVLIFLLLTAAAFTLERFERVKPEDPLGKKLLYLPNEQFFRVVFFGNTPLAADMLYLWSIQHFSRYAPNTQFQYLDRVYELITNLDPRYIDPYRIGALIMLIEAEGDPGQRKESVLKLLDKGIRNNPDDYTLAVEAAWKCYMNFNDLERAVFYANVARHRNVDDPWLDRMYGYFSRKSGSMPLDELIQYWTDLYNRAQTDYQRMATSRQLFDLIAERDKQRYNPYLEAFRQRRDRCPQSWEEVIRSGIAPEGQQPLQEVPKDFKGNEYLIDQEACSLVVFKKISEQ